LSIFKTGLLKSSKDQRIKAVLEAQGLYPKVLVIFHHSLPLLVICFCLSLLGGFWV